MFTCAALLFSGLGYWTEYTLFKSFGINVVVFASLDDFFLAGLKYPDVLIQLFAPILFLIVGSYLLLRQRGKRLSQIELKTSEQIKEIESKIEKHKNTDLFSTEPSALEKHHTSKRYELELTLKELRTSLLKERSRLIGTMGLMFLIGTCVAFLLVSTLSNKQVEQIKKNPEYYSEVFLRGGSKLPNKDKDKLVFISATDKFVFFSKFKTDEVISVPVASITHINQVKVAKGPEVKVKKSSTSKDKTTDKCSGTVNLAT